MFPEEEFQQPESEDVSADVRRDKIRKFCLSFYGFALNITIIITIFVVPAIIKQQFPEYVTFAAAIGPSVSVVYFLVLIAIYFIDFYDDELDSSSEETAVSFEESLSLSDPLNRQTAQSIRQRRKKSTASTDETKITSNIVLSASTTKNNETSNIKEKLIADVPDASEPTFPDSVKENTTANIVTSETKESVAPDSAKENVTLNTSASQTDEIVSYSVVSSSNISVDSPNVPSEQKPEPSTQL